MRIRAGPQADTALFFFLAERSEAMNLIRAKP